MNKDTKNVAECTNAYIELMKSTKFSAPEAMLLSPETLKKGDATNVTGMLRALSVGDHDGFVAKAEALGVRKNQAILAARDTAALGALVMQFGCGARW